LILHGNVSGGVSFPRDGNTACPSRHRNAGSLCSERSKAHWRHLRLVGGSAIFPTLFAAGIADILPIEYISVGWW
jgi:hypothetical protein